MSLTKADFRKECLVKIRTASRHNKNYSDALLVKNLEHILKEYPHKKILMYWPLRFEADITKLLHRSRRRREVYLPFMEAESFKMVAYRLPMERKSFGIFEPGQSLKNIKNIDIAIVPAVGVDGSGRRIGFGKGMYDRFFEKLPKKPMIIFVQSQLCMSNKKICDYYDISADLLVTPYRCYSAQGTYNVRRVGFSRRRRCTI